MKFVAQAKIESQAASDFEFLSDEKVVVPAPLFYYKIGEGPRAGSGDAEQKVGVGIPCETIRERDVAEQVGRRAAIGVVSAANAEAGSYGVTAVEPTQVFLKLIDEVFEAGMTPDLLREILNSEAAPIQLKDALDVWQIGSETLQAERLNECRSALRAVARLVVISNAPSEFVEKIRTDRVRVGYVRALVFALIFDAADGGEVVVPAS